MAFRTKIDFSDNRQAKQRVETIQELSGATHFGVTFSSLPTGPDLSTSGVSATYSLVNTLFSGNTGSTIYVWGDSRMSLGEVNLSAITPSNSATTQHTGSVYTADTTTTIDGNLVTLTYSGVSFGVSVTGMTDLGGGNYSGDIVTYTLNIISAGTIDFTGRTIWNDVSGITRTERLIVTSSPQVGYVLKCIDTEGMAQWSVDAGSIGATVWTSGSTGTNSIKAINGTATDATGNYAVAQGSNTIAGGDNSHTEGVFTTTMANAAHAEGIYSTAIAGGSHAEGFSTTASGITSHVEGYLSFTSGYASHAEGQGTIASGDNSHSEGRITLSSGNFSHAEGYGTTAIGAASHAEGSGTTASGTTSHAEGSGTTAINDFSHAGGIHSIASGLGSFVHGSGNTVTGNRSVVIGGSNLTGATDDYVYVPSLNINLVGSSAFANDIRIDGSGNLTTNTSDIRLKENITTLNDALTKVKQLRGVTYNWKDRIAGGESLRIGFIAQEVEMVDPLLVFTNKHDGYMGLHIDSIIPLLVEAIKELSTGYTINNVKLETQTIFAEDNNIELNYGGNEISAIGGGITVLHAMGQNLDAQIITDSEGNWKTNNDFKPKALTIPIFTPTSSNDTTGSDGNITRDDNYLYIKTKNGWKRTNLESF